MGHALSVLRRAEDGDAIVGCSESFDAFIGLLSVVQARCHSMDVEERVFDKLRGSPFSSFNAVMRFDVPVDWRSVSNVCAMSNAELQDLRVL